MIILWQILGFSSDDPPPSHDIAPLPHIPQPNDFGASQFTRSAFVPNVSSECPFQYIRSIQFHTPRCDEYFFLRFELHFQPDQHPVLTFCNRTGEIFFWDLARLKAYEKIMADLKDPNRDRNRGVRIPQWFGRLRSGANSKSRTTSVGKGSQAGSTPEVEDKRLVYDIADLNPKDVKEWEAKYHVKDRDSALEPHHKIEVQFRKRTPFLGRQAAWSPAGDWCVVAGSGNVVHVLRRWTKAHENS